ncbi:MAG TPA: protein kinase, partial [Roseiflexaceae bacterium]|nr:protein kinase [Roseiflexaceae bacterium]
LNELLSAGRFMPRSELLATVAQLAAALDAAHAIGVIHRDVKPSNAIANAAGELVLTDFGIARSSGDTNLTSPGVLLGTPNYVAPEQATTNSGLTIAVDVYALGVLTFQLLTNELPFSGATATAVVIKHLAEDPPKPSDRRPDLPPAIDSVVLRAATPRPVVAAPRQRRMLPWLGLLLMLFFVLAAIAAWRGSTPVPDHAGQPGSAAPTSIRERPAAVAATSAPPPSEQPVATAEPTPTELRLPTATTEPSPTLMPTEPPSPTDPPALEAPVDMVDPVLALGALLTAGDADGRAGQRGKELLDHYWKLIDALANGESRKAEDQIRDMRRKLAERKRDQPIDPEFVAETEQLLDRILQIYQLRRR